MKCGTEAIFEGAVSAISPKQELVPELPTNPLMMPELLGYTLQYVPSYQLLGHNKLSTVSKHWHRTLNAYHFTPANFEKVLDECRRSPGIALSILTDKNIQPYLDLEKAIALAGCHPEFAKNLLTKKRLKDYLFQYLDVLGQNNIEVAKQLLSYGNNQTVLVRMCQKLPEIAMMIVTDESRIRLFTAAHLSQIAKNHYEVVTYILNTEHLYKKLTRKNLIYLAELVQEFSGIAMNRLSSVANFTGQELAILGQKQPTVAMHILQTESLLKKLSEKDLAILGQFLPEVAMQVLGRWDLSEKALLILGQTPKIALYLLQTPELFNKLSFESVVYFGGRHSIVAMFILNNNNLCKQLSGIQLSILAKSSPKVAIHILDTQMPKIEWHRFIEIIYRNPNVMAHIQKTPLLLSQFKESIQNFDTRKFETESKVCRIIFEETKEYLAPSMLSQVCNSISHLRIKKK